MYSNMTDRPDKKRRSSGDGAGDTESKAPTSQTVAIGGSTRRRVLGTVAGGLATIGLGGQATALDRGGGSTTLPDTGDEWPLSEYPGDEWPWRQTIGTTSSHCLPETLDVNWESEALADGVESLLVRPGDRPVHVWGLSTTDGNGDIYALDRDTGEVLSGWPIETSGRPSVATRGGDRLYYADVDPTTDSTAIYAVDAETGEAVWDTTVQDDIVTVPIYNPSADTLYIVSQVGPRITALDGTDGSTLWNSQVGQEEGVSYTRPRGSTLYIVSGATDDAGSITTYVRAVNVSASAEGQERWSVTEEGVVLTGFPAYSQDSVVLGFGPQGGSGGESVLVSLARGDGTEQWTKSRSDDLAWAGLVRFLDSGLYAPAGSTSGGSSEGVLTRVTPGSGATEWEYDAGGLVTSYQRGDDRIYAGTLDGTVAAINDDPGGGSYGQEVWSKAIENGSGESLELGRLLLRCGRLYTATAEEPGTLYILDANGGDTLDTFTVDSGVVRSLLAVDGSLWAATFVEPEFGDSPAENHVYKFGEEADGSPDIQATVGLDPETGTIAPGGEQSFGVVVAAAENGVGAYEMRIEVGDASVATIGEVTPTQNPAASQIDIAGDGASADISVVMGTNGYGSGDSTVADLTIAGEGPGSTPVSLSDVTVAGTGDTPYDLTDVSGASVTVAADETPPPVVGENPPQDLDEDGLYEDIDGDGEFTIGDVYALFQQRGSTVVQENPEYFNFAGEESGDVTLDDVQALFQLYQEQQ
jgi:outer membrane protein assembly factor BamB